MIIEALRLNNIRSYKNEMIVFPAGSTLLAGDIGAGKSTILLAIEFALFGLRRKHLTGHSLLRKGARQGEVELSFSLHGKKVLIKRVLKKSKARVEQSSGYMVIDEVKQDLTAVELKAKVLEMLNYPMELLTKSKNLIYTYTVYTPQEEMKAILTEDADVRLDVLRKVFGFNKYKLVRENCQIAFKEMRGKIKVYEGSTADLVEKKRFRDQYKSELKLLEQELKKTESSLVNIKQDYETKLGDVNILEKQKQELQDLKKSLMSSEIRYEERLKNKELVEQNINTSEKEINCLKEKISQISVVKPLVDKVNLESSLKQKEELIFSIVNQENAVKAKLSFLESSISNLDNEVKELSVKSAESIKDKVLLESLEKEVLEKESLLNQQKEFEQKFMSVNEQVQSFKLKKEGAHETITKISKLQNCPLCLQEVSHVHKDQIHQTETGKINQLNGKLNEIFKEKSLFENRLTEIHSTLQVIAAKELEIGKIKVKIDMFNSEKLSQKQKQLQEFILQKKEFEDKLIDIQKNNIIDLKEDIEKLKNELKDWQKYETSIKEKADYEKRVEALANSKIKHQEQLTEIEKELVNLGLVKKDFRSKIESFKNLELKFKVVKEELENITKIEKELIAKQASQVKGISGLNEMLRNLEVEITKKEKDLGDMNLLKQKLNWLNKSFVPLTITIERQIMAQVYHLFNELFKKWLNLLIEDYLLSVSLDKEFSPLISQNGFDIEFSHLSGGEKTSVALAYRLALNRVINDLYRGIGTSDLIILDEPTDGFSTEHLDKLREVFDELNMAQLIIVSHENKIESFVENVIHVNKDEHVSSIYC